MKSTTEQQRMHEELSDILDKLNKKMEIILLGNLNARTRSKKNDKIVGQFGEVVNRNMEKLFEFSPNIN